LLTYRLPGFMQRVLQRIALAITAIYAGFILWFGWNFTVHAWRQEQVSATLLAVPVWIPSLLIPLGGLLLLIASVGALIAPRAAAARSG